jgi:hypothetical protein
LNVEVVFRLVGLPGRAFGLPLRDDGDLQVNRAMWDILRGAYAKDRKIHVEYVREDLFHNTALRIWPVP